MFISYLFGLLVLSTPALPSAKLPDPPAIIDSAFTVPEAEAATVDDYTSTSSVVRLLKERTDLAGFSKKEQENFIEIARCESRFRQFEKPGVVLHGIVHYPDVGIMQINTSAHGDRIKALGLDVEKPVDNVDFGIVLYKESGALPWASSAGCHHVIN